MALVQLDCCCLLCLPLAQGATAEGEEAPGVDLQDELRRQQSMLRRLQRGEQIQDEDLQALETPPELGLPDQANPQPQDSVATLPPSVAPAPQAPPTEVAATRIDPPDAPSVADASREAGPNRAELPDPDLASAARPVVLGPLNSDKKGCG